MTKEVRRLLNYSVDLIYKKVDFSKLKFDLSECYAKCSSKKLTANRNNIFEFCAERNIFEEKTKKPIKYLQVIPSYNKFNFTSLQIAYFFEDESKEDAYIVIRYDTFKRTIKKYIEYSKYDMNIATLYNSLDEMLANREQFNNGHITENIYCKPIKLKEQEPNPLPIATK